MENDLTLNKLTVLDTIKIPPLSISDSSIISINGNKITPYINCNIISSGVVSNQNFNYLAGQNQFLRTNSNVGFNSVYCIDSNGYIIRRFTNGKSSIIFLPEATNVATNLAFYSFPPLHPNIVNDTVVMANLQQTLKNKLLDSSTTFFINPNGTTTTSFIFQSNVNTQITIPNRSDTLVNLGSVQTLSSKTLASSCAIVNPVFRDLTYTTKRVVISVSSLSGTRGWSFPDTNDTFVGISSSQTISNKTLLSPSFSGVASGIFRINGPIYSSNNTNSINTTSNASIRTDGGISCAKDLYASNLNAVNDMKAESIYGKNKLTNWFVCILENTIKQDLQPNIEERVKFNTIVKNPSNMNIHMDSLTINETGYWLISFSTFHYNTSAIGSYKLYLVNGGIYELWDSKPCPYYLENEGYIIQNTKLLYLNSGTNLWFIIKSQGSGLYISQDSNSGQNSRLSVQFMGF